MNWLSSQTAVLIPLIGLSLLTMRAETALRTGPTFQIEIGGYDPRDLLHGHFLRYRYEFNWQGDHTCGGALEGGEVLTDDCCICLTLAETNGIDPPATRMQCNEIEPGTCDGVLTSSSVKPPQKYFIPEKQAPEIENAVRVGTPSLELTCGIDQTPAIRELLIDGVPWQDIIGAEEAGD
jgi:hypothetical protein